MKIWTVIYQIVAKDQTIERTVLCVAPTKAHALDIVAKAEPDDVCMHLQSCKWSSTHENLVWQLAERTIG